MRGKMKRGKKGNTDRIPEIPNCNANTCIYLYTCTRCIPECTSLLYHLFGGFGFEDSDVESVGSSH